MKKSIYTTPQTDILLMNVQKSYMLVDWTAPDGTRGGNTPDANEWTFEEEYTSPHSKIDLWGDE